MNSFLDCGKKEDACIWRGLYSLSTGLWPCPDVSHGLSVTYTGHKLQRAAVGKSGEEDNLVLEQSELGGVEAEQLPNCSWW